MKPEVSVFGTGRDGRDVRAVTLENRDGSRIRVCEYGATLLSWRVAGDTEVVLGYDNLAAYLRQRACLGAIVGRAANRVGHGRIRIDGVDYQLDQNLGEHHLHGGVGGFNSQRWSMVDSSLTDSAVTLRRVSPDGEMGYPGTLDCQLTFRIAEDNTLSLDYVARTDRPTYVNFTHHSYFDLSGRGDVHGHQLQVFSDRILATDQHQVARGDTLPVVDTPLDFRQMRGLRESLSPAHALIRNVGGLDQCYLFDRGPSGNSSQLMAELRYPDRGLRLTVEADGAQGLQVYSGQSLNPATDGYGPFSGLCLEPQDLPNAPNVAAWQWLPLTPGGVYQRKIVYRAGPI